MSKDTTNTSSNIATSLETSELNNKKNNTITDAACAMGQKPTGSPIGEEESAYMRLWNYEVYKKAYEDAAATTSTAAAENSSNKEANVDVAVLQTLYEELQSLTAPQNAHERLSAGGKETHAAEKFCCCPTAQCYVCQNGVSGVARVSSPAPTSYWRVPNQCPCFDAQNKTGELRGTATNNTYTQNRTSGGGCAILNTKRVDAEKRNICPNTLQPLGKLYLPLPSIKYCQRSDNTNDLTNKYIKLKCFKKTARKQLVSNKPTTLGNTVGLIKSTDIVYSNDEAKQKERFATYLKAIALLHLKEATQWQSTDLDRLIKEGKELCAQISEYKMSNMEIRNDVYSLVEEKVPRTFKFDEHDCQVELEASNWIRMLRKNLYDNLNYFFKKHANAYCLLQLRHWYVLIWRDKGGAYFVLDMNGRNAKTLLTKIGNVSSNQSVQQTDDMFAVLLCLRELINVVQLIVNMSNLQAGERFLIREIFMAKFSTPDGKSFQRTYGQRYPEYIIVNASYAYLRTNLHLTLNANEPIRNRSALPVALAAMIAAKIDHPATWNIKTLDQLICFGVNTCRLCWKPCVDLQKPINLNTFPRCLHMGQFLINYEISPEAFTGIWKCNLTLENYDFRTALERAFEISNNLLLQIEQQMYAIWRKRDFYYLLDPYLHTIWGMSDATKSATLRMFNNFDSLFYILKHILMQSTHSAQFFIHTLKIRKIKNCGKCKEGFTETIDKANNMDVLSLNENIDYAQDFQDCFYELSRKSSYGSELSEVNLLKSVTSSLTYIPEGEEEMENEANMKNLDFSELESSSSGQKRKKVKSSTKNRTDVVETHEHTNNTLNNLNKTARKRRHSKTMTQNLNNLENRQQKHNKYIAGKLNGKENRKKPKKLNTMENAKENSKIDAYKITHQNNDTLANFKKSYPIKPIVKHYNRNNYRINNYNDKNDAILSKSCSTRNTRTSTYNPAMQKKFIESLKQKETLKPSCETHEPLNESNISSAVSLLPEELNELGNLKWSNLVNGKNSLIKISEIFSVNSITARIDMPRESFTEEYNKKIDKQQEKLRREIMVQKVIHKWINATKSKLAHYGGAFVSGICCQPILRRIYGNMNKSCSNIRFEISKDINKTEEVQDIEKDIKALECNTPRLTQKLRNLFIAPVEKPTYTKIYGVIRRGFKHTDRVLIRTNWGNFVIFCGAEHMKNVYYVYDGCTCCTERFKYLDLSSGTAGLLPFCSLNDVVCYIIDTHDLRQFSSKEKINIFQNGCQKCNKNLCCAK